MFEVTSKFIPLIFLQILLNILIIKLWNNKLLRQYHNVYQAEQKIHKGFVPRFGGFVMLLTFFLFEFFTVINPDDYVFINGILISLCPLVFVTLLEDVYNNILPIARLFFIILSSFLYLFFFRTALPFIDIPILSEFFVNYPIFLIILLCLGITSVVNAFNFIDGANGLLLLTFISILTSLRLMVYIPEEHYFKNIIDVLISICLIQLIFNYPIAKIFAGDLGAYSFGFIIACLVISIFGIYPQYLTWQAIMVLFYPILEIIFTMTRRLLNNKSPFEADRYHLHQLIFTYFCKYFKTYLSNSLTTATLIPIFIFSPIWIYLNNVNLDLYSIILGLFLNLLMYLTYYIFFSRLVNAK